MTTRDAAYFLRKLRKIPSSQWCTTPKSRVLRYLRSLQLEGK